MPMPYTATVTLTRAWLIDPTDPTTVVVTGSSGSTGGATAAVRTSTRDGEVRAYAAGRYRAVLGPGTTRTIGLTLRGVTPDQELQIEAWKGTLLLYRDTYGVRQFGCYLSTQVTQRRNASKADITLDWRELTYVESA